MIRRVRRALWVGAFFAGLAGAGAAAVAWWQKRRPRRFWLFGRR